MDHQRCTKTHFAIALPPHCTTCGEPAWPCRGWLLDHVERLAHELVDAETGRITAETERDDAAAAVSLLEEELAGLRLYTVAEADHG